VDHRGSRGIALPFFDHNTRRGEGPASRPAALYPGVRPGTYCMGGTQELSGQVRKISPPTGIRSPDLPARSQSLYRLRYPAHRVALEQDWNLETRLILPQL